MSRIIEVATWEGEARASVVFAHGLGGHAYDTWRRGVDDGTFWPLWLATDVEGVAVHTLAYEAPPSNWLGTSMALQDRAATCSRPFSARRASAMDRSFSSATALAVPGVLPRLLGSQISH